MCDQISIVTISSKDTEVISVSSESSYEVFSVKEVFNDIREVSLIISIDVGMKNLCYSLALFHNSRKSYQVVDCRLESMGEKITDIDKNVSNLVRRLNEENKLYSTITVVIEKQINFKSSGSRFSLAPARNSRIEGCLHSAFASVGIKTHSYRLPNERGLSYYQRKKKSVKTFQEMLTSEPFCHIVAISVKDLFHSSEKKDDISDSVRMLISWIETKKNYIDEL